MLDMSPCEKLYLVHNRDTLGRILYGLLDAIVIRADRPLPPLGYARHSLAMNSVSNSTSTHYQSSLASPLTQKRLVSHVGFVVGQLPIASAICTRPPQPRAPLGPSHVISALYNFFLNVQ